MADPITMLALAGTAGGGIMTGIGKILSTSAEAKQLGFQADVNQKLASIATANANLDFAAGETKALQAGEVSQAAGERIIASAGARNLGPTTGSTAQAYMSQRGIGQENQRIAYADAAHAAWGEQIQSAEKTTAASADIAGIQNVYAALPTELAGTFATTVGSVAGKWYELQKTSPQGGVATMWPDPNNPGGYAPGYD